ncbi:MAG: hypothetical protein KDK78_05070, partial [Chlamydiia bacterium]|nr:hypothetical protein [Chlamydiia bacterium]
LVVLERAYLRVNLTLQMAEAAWTDDLFKVAETLLTRMDAVLLSLGFPKEHADRMFIAKVRIENQESYQRWLLRRHHVSDQDR